MTPKQRILNHLARIKAGLPVEAQVLLTGEFEKDGTGSRTALRKAFDLVKKSFKFNNVTKSWGKREEGDTSEPAAPIYSCVVCNAVQPLVNCHACGGAGPGRYCIGCGNANRYSCPDCDTSWHPVSMEDDAEGDRSIDATVTATRSEPEGIWRVEMFANTEVRDTHKTFLFPEKVKPLIKPGFTRIDVNHDFAEVPGSRIENVNFAEKPAQDETGKTRPCRGVTLDMIFDTKVPARTLPDGRTSKSAAQVVEGFRNGTYIGGSVHFHHDAAEAEAVAAGRTDVINPCMIDWVTVATKPSNKLSTVTKITHSGMRTMRLEGEEPEPEKPADADPNAALKALAQAEDPGKAPPTEKPSDAKPGSPAPVVPPAPGAVTLESLATQLDTATATITAMRTEAQQALESGLKPLIERCEIAEGLLAKAQELIAQQGGHLAELMELTPKVIARLETGMRTRTVTPEQLAEVRSYIDSKCVPEPKRGTTGAVEDEEKKITADGRTQEEKDLDERLKRCESDATMLRNALMP